jgi:hypothetical protein
MSTTSKRARWELILPAALLAASLTVAGCARKMVVPSPTSGTAAGGILNNPQASPALKAQAAQQVQIGQREQQLQQQAQHAGAANPGPPK